MLLVHFMRENASIERQCASVDALGTYEMAGTTIAHIQTDESMEPNAATRAAMLEAEQIIKARRARFNTAEPLVNELEKTGTHSELFS